MLKWFVGALLGPFLKLGEHYLDNQKDKQKLDAGVTKVAYEVDASVRQMKLGNLLGRLPLFVAEVSVAGYVAVVLFDSAFPTDLVNPLKLPAWFEPHFTTVLASVVGLAVFERVMGRFGR